MKFKHYGDAPWVFKGRYVAWMVLLGVDACTCAFLAPAQRAAAPTLCTHPQPPTRRLQGAVPAAAGAGGGGGEARAARAEPGQPVRVSKRGLVGTEARRHPPEKARAAPLLLVQCRLSLHVRCSSRTRVCAPWTRAIERSRCLRTTVTLTLTHARALSHTLALSNMRAATGTRWVVSTLLAMTTARWASLTRCVGAGKRGRGGAVEGSRGLCVAARAQQKKVYFCPHTFSHTHLHPHAPAPTRTRTHT